jgi:hypothetical protein
MIYKECIDRCFETVKACDRLSVKECEADKDCKPAHCHAVICAEVCALVARLTAKGICHKELYDLCANICDECHAKCNGIDNKCAKDCEEACKKSAESCRACAADCKKCEK